MCRGLRKGWGLGGWWGVDCGDPHSPSSTLRRVWDRGPDRGPPGCSRHLCLLHQHLQLRPCLGEPPGWGGGPGGRGRGQGDPDASLCPPARRCPRTASAASSRSSSAGRTAWALEAPGAGHSSLRGLPGPLASRDFSKLCAPALGRSCRGAPSFRSVYVSCKQTPALNVAAACLPNAGDVVLWASSRKPSTLPAGPQGLHIPCLRPEPPPSPRRPRLGCLTQQRSSDRAFPSWGLQEKYFYTSLSLLFKSTC